MNIHQIATLFVFMGFAALFYEVAIKRIINIREQVKEGRRKMRGR